MAPLRQEAVHQAAVLLIFATMPLDELASLRTLQGGHNWPQYGAWFIFGVGLPTLPMPRSTRLAWIVAFSLGRALISFVIYARTQKLAAVTVVLVNTAGPFLVAVSASFAAARFFSRSAIAPR